MSVVAIHTGLMPRWTSYLGLTLALILLLGSGYTSWSILVFPFWVFLVSMWILLENLAFLPARLPEKQ
jgi:hypothetical protein